MNKFLLLLASFSLFALEEEELVWDDLEPSVTEYNTSLQQALESKDWWSVIDYGSAISYNFPTSPFAQETSYLMGLAYYQMEQFELANDSLTEYLNLAANHKHLEDAIRMKYEIAEAFANGTKKKRLFGSHKMPAWVPAQEDAIAIFDEVIIAVPHSDIAAKSLLSKGKIQASLEDYKDAIETLSQLIRKFPKHECAAEAYLEINRVYLTQCKNTSLDLDLLDLATVNLRKFQLAFPREPRLTEAEDVLAETKELFAQNLLSTGQFYDKTKKKAAAQIYYNKVVSKYPETKAAEVARAKVVTETPL
jgi:outer membrane assembly lipoprotein YfiO